MSEETKDPKLSPVLQSIKNDLEVVGTFMRDFSMHVIFEEISHFPVYIAYEKEVALGKPFFSKEEHNLNWNYNATILEELIKRGVVQPDKAEQFKKTYGDPEERACIFIVMEQEGGFVFVPY